MLPIAVIFAVALVAYTLLTYLSDDSVAAGHTAAFDKALAQESSAVMRALLSAARPLSGNRVVNVAEESPTYRNIRLKLVGGGGLYGSSVEVFLSAQVACLVVASTIVGAVLVLPSSGVVKVMAVVGAAALASWPYSRVREAFNKRTREVDSALPEFAELLLMPLTSGFGVLAALTFTAERSQGPVAEEVALAVDSVRRGVRSEADAFGDAADNLGTLAARSFFSALSQAYTDGVRVSETIRGQAEQLRKLHYERLREDIKKVPNKVAIIIGLHLIPSLFILTLYPAFSSLANL